MPKKSQNSSVLNDFLISIMNQWVKCVFAFLPLNSSGNREKLAQKSVVACKKLGSRDQRPLHRKGAKSAKNFLGFYLAHFCATAINQGILLIKALGEASLAPTTFKEYGCPAGQGTMSLVNKLFSH